MQYPVAIPTELLTTPKLQDKPRRDYAPATCSSDRENPFQGCTEPHAHWDRRRLDSVGWMPMQCRCDQDNLLWSPGTSTEVLQYLQTQRVVCGLHHWLLLCCAPHRQTMQCPHRHWSQTLAMLCHWGRAGAGFSAPALGSVGFCQLASLA